MCEIGKFHFICEGQSVYRSKCAFAEMKSAPTPFLSLYLQYLKVMGCSEKYSAVLLSDFNFSAAELIRPLPHSPQHHSPAPTHPLLCCTSRFWKLAPTSVPFFPPSPHFYLSTAAAGFRTAPLHQMAVTDRSRPAPYNYQKKKKAPDAAFSNACQGSTAAHVGFYFFFQSN